MCKRGMLLLVLIIFVFSLAGCATTSKKSQPTADDLKNQISILETQIREKDAKISALEEELSKTDVRSEYVQVKCGKAYSRTTKQIQAALKNAGYNPGVIDGKMGKQTRDAIKAFQKANSLTVDGRCGKDPQGCLSALILVAVLNEYFLKIGWLGVVFLGRGNHLAGTLQVTAAQ